MTNHMHCATCGTHVRLTDQTVSCPKCETDAPLTAAILTIEAQASEIGRRLDVQSVKPDARGKLAYSFVERARKQRAKRGNVA